MDKKLQHELEKNEFYESLIDKAVGKKIIIYGASSIGKNVLKELKNRGENVFLFCVTDKKLNCTNIEQIPVSQIDEITPEIYNSSIFVIAMKIKNQKSVIKILDEKGINDYICIPDSLCNSEINLQRVYIPGMEITTRIGCSVNCKYCPQDVLCKKYSNKHKETMLSLENFKICIDKLPKETIVLFSGFVEPFLNPNCIDMLEYSVANGYHTLLNTTLVGLKKEQAKRLVKLPIEHICLHTPDIDEYANIPMSEEYFEILDFLLNSKKKNGRPFIDVANCQSTPHPKVIKFINNRVSFSNIILIDRAGNLEKSEIYENVNHIGNIICERSVILNRNVLLPDGTVVLCCMDFALQHELGNLLVSTYEEIMNGEEMCEIKRNMEIGVDVLCRKCSFARQI